MSALRIAQYVVAMNGVLLAIQSLRVVATYSAVYSLSPHNWRRQLPLHVWLMALSFAVYAGATTYFLLIGGQQNAWARVVLYGSAGFIGQYALWQVLKYDRRRYSKATTSSTPTVMTTQRVRRATRSSYCTCSRPLRLVRPENGTYSPRHAPDEMLAILGRSRLVS